ncbi:endonuclease domain-containing protein [Aggregatilinea lenta]|uniref:endonuclease domain-containing protein n=1 Tax=Aggregatilinea lenta TaxID=913108 RepID=UPI000E5B44CB|nr:endonuclease domain-containing protein [Aggregatilinea lenta]
MADDELNIRARKSAVTQWIALKPVARQYRHQSTPAEDTLWQRLRNRQVAGLKFRRQVAIDCFIVDFYCAERKLAIEVDGSIHASQADEDAVRQAHLESRGLHILRFANEQVLDHIDDVIAAITAAVAS